MTDDSPVLDSDVLELLSVLEAFARDYDRAGDQRAPDDGADAAWLIVGHTMERAASLRGFGTAASADLFAAAAATLRMSARQLSRHTRASKPVIAQMARAFRTLARVLHHVGLRAPAEAIHADSAAPRDAIALVVGSVQSLCAEQERAGALQLAYVTLGWTRFALLSLLSEADLAALAAQQGRAARTLGSLSLAEAHYEAALSHARRAKAPGAQARALLGSAALQMQRGNYPAARQALRRASRLGKQIGDVPMVRSANHGLLTCALASGDAAEALAYAWEAMRAAGPGDDEQSEALINLAEACLLAREYRAALAGALRALELVHHPRLRLGALGGAVRAAARLDERRLCEHLVQDIERTVRRAADHPWEVSMASVETLEAYVAIGDWQAATRAAERARARLGTRAFHEVAFRLETAEREIRTHTRRTASPPPLAETRDPIRSLRTRRIIRAVERLHGTTAESMSSSTR